MGKRSREKRAEDVGGSTGNDGGGGGIQWLPVVLAAGALVLAFVAWSDTKTLKDDMTRRFGDVGNRVDQVQKQVAAAAAAKPAQQQQGPDPAKAYTIKLDGSPVRGKASAPVTIAEFSDFQCPFCSRVTPTMKQIEEVYGDKVRVVWKNHPLPFHPNALPAAVAAMAANEQGKFWEYHDLLFANQQKQSKDDFIQYAKNLKLDIARFTRDMDPAKYKAKIDADSDEAMNLGASGTPAFFVNGHFVNGAKPFAEFAKVINAELQRLNLPIPAAAQNPS